MTDYFDEIDRVDLAGPPTPLQEMERLRAALESTGTACPRLFVKREDLTQTAGGGNKIRKLEYLLADARAKHADVIVTAGALQSNHVRQTAGGADYGDRAIFETVKLIQSTRFILAGHQKEIGSRLDDVS